MTDQHAKWRFAFSMIVLMAAMVGLGVRLAFLHLGFEERKREGVENSRRLEKKIHPGRGVICDRKGDGNILAINLFVKDICADPRAVVKSNLVSKVATQLADKLDLPVDELAMRLNQPDKRFVYIKRMVRQEIAAEVGRQNIAGIFFQDATARQYPHGNFMCHVLGFVNNEGLGGAGIELSLDRYLRGSPGCIESKVDALRQELYAQRSRYIPALEGANVILTVDQNIQYIVEKALDEAMVAHHAKGAWAIVERVKTGEILALASRPAYDLNEFADAVDNVKLDRAIGMVYEPGSTFKPIVSAAALNEGLVTPETVFDCEKGSWMYCRHVLRDYHPYGNLTVADGTKKSSNILHAKLALMLGDKRYYQYLCAFGMGKKTGIDLPGEEVGILHSPAKWSGLSATRIAIGQGISVTALQMVNMISAIANDGCLMKPYIVQQIVKSDGSILFSNKPEMVSRPIKPETAATMRKMLRGVTEDGGTGTKARVEGYEVAGKTGTAQKPVDGRYSSTAYTASFLGFLPVEAPEIAVIVVVDEPQPIHLGGVVAAPIFGRIASQVVRYLDVPTGGDSSTSESGIVASHNVVMPATVLAAENTDSRSR